MKRILTLALLSLCGCVGRGTFNHQKDRQKNFQDHASEMLGDLDNRLQHLESIIQAEARDRAAQSNRYDLGGMDELAEESAKETDRKLKPELDKLLGR